MMAALAIIWQKHWGSILIVVGVLALVSIIYLKGHADGVSETERDAREAVFNQLKERDVTNEEVGKMSDPELCRAIGGELRDGRCL